MNIETSDLLHTLDLKRLHTKHRKIEKELDRLKDYTSYSVHASMRIKELKKQKLAYKERIFELLEKNK